MAKKLTGPHGDDLPFRFQIGEWVRSTMDRRISGTIREGYLEESQGGQIITYDVDVGQEEFFTATQDDLEPLTSPAR